MRITPRRFLLVASVIALVFGLTSCNTVVTSPVNYDCQIKSNNIFVPNTTGTMDSDYETSSPPTVAPAASFNVTVKPEPFTVDGTDTSDGQVTQLSNLVWRFQVPANSTLNSQTISGWSNVGSGTPTSSVSGTIVTVTVPGPIPANTTAILPTLTLNLKATGAVGSHITPRVAGTSYSSTGLSFNVRVVDTIAGTLNPTFNCYPSPNPNLHDVEIKAA